MKPVRKKEAATAAWRPTIAGSHYAASCGHYLAICSILRDAQTGLLHAGADPRREAYAMAW